MVLVAGIDPGTSGAIAVFDTSTRRCVRATDMPTWWVTKGKSKKKRKRIDMIALAAELDLLVALDVKLVVMERVNGLPGQSASSAFSFGVGVGQLYMALVAKRLIFETVPPLAWKRALNVPGKTGKEGEDNKTIMSVAEALFPADHDKFRGVRGGMRVDRAEAAMIAMFGGERVLPSLGNDFANQEHYALYQNVET